ncbi:MAG: diguanylate cyclase [Brevinematia bacterium]
MKRPIIGVLIAQLEGKYQSPIFKGISRKAEELDVNLIFFNGKLPNSPFNFEKNENIIYDLAHSPLIDGLVFVSGNLSNFLSYEEFLSFFNKFDLKAKVSISIEIKNYPSIIINNKKAMKEMISHLIEEHNYKKIAFVSGPLNHREALDRLEGYKEALSEHNIQLDEKLVFYGDFSIEAGYKAVKVFLDERKVLPEAIACANDTMAFSALSELKRRGFLIPRDVAITGFDDQEDIRLTEPPITTVMQPLEEEGKLALQLAVKMVKGEEVPKIVELDCKPVLRQSCGCIGLKIKNHKPHFPDGEYLKLLESIINNYVDKNISSTDQKRKLEKIVKITLNLIENPLEFFKNLSLEITESNGDEIFLKNVYDFFDNLITGSGEYSELHTFSSYFQKALYLVNSAFRRIDGRKRLELEWMMLRLRDLTQNLFTITTLSEFKEAIYQIFFNFNFKFYSMIFFKKEPLKSERIKKRLPQKSVIECQYQKSPKNTCTNIEFNTLELLPANLLPEERFSLAVMCVYHRDKIFGYMAMDVNPEENEIMYVCLQEVIGISLRIVTLWKEQIKSQKKLERFNIELKEIAEKDSLTGIYNRRGFFEYGEKIIISAQEKKQNITVFFIDLDNLKHINDKYGHTEGDEALRNTAFILRECFRKTDLIARVGGDEFVVIAVNKKGEKNLEEILTKRLYNLLQKFNLTSNQDYILSFSVGSSTFAGEEIISLENIISIVDEKLYIEKQRRKSFR